MKQVSALAAVVAVLACATAGQAAGPTTISSTYSAGGGSVPGASTGLVLTSGMSVTGLAKH